MSQSYDVFISYSRADKERVHPWVEELKNAGVSVFIDTESLTAGNLWHEKISEAIRAAKAVMLFVSHATSTSDYVPREVALAAESRKTLLPVLLDEREIPGQIALYLAGVHRINAFDPDRDKVRHAIRSALQSAGVEWRTALDIHRAGREIRLDQPGGNKNVRTRRGGIRVHEVAEREPEPSRGRVGMGIYLVLLLLAAGSVAFFWLGGRDSLGGIAAKPPLAANNEPPQPAPPRADVVTFEEEATVLVRNYFGALNEDPLSLAPFLAASVDYHEDPQCTPADVEKIMALDKQGWTVYRTELLKTPEVRIVEKGIVAEGTANLRLIRANPSIQGNPVIESVDSFTRKVRMQMVDGWLRITQVSEVPNSRITESIRFQPEEQQKAAIAFVTKAALSGNSNTKLSPQDIAAMFLYDASGNADYFEKKISREDIVTEVKNVATLWELREFRLLQEPRIIGELEQPDVTVEVLLEYTFVSPSRLKNAKGWVRSHYSLHFDGSGTPLIQKSQEVERGK